MNPHQRFLHAPRFIETASEVCERYAIFGKVPQAVAFPSKMQDVSGAIQFAVSVDAHTVVWGLGARQHLCPPPVRYHLAIDMRRMSQVVRYEPADLTVTVRAGCSVAELEAVLAAHGQWLGLEPALPEETTIGGLIASTAEGPLRASFGRVRDALLGIRFVSGDGRLVRAGGQVVKNVAGYDLMKLLTGSWGTLGVIVEATFKVRPRPPKRVVYRCASGSWQELLSLAATIDESGLQPDLLAVMTWPVLPARKRIREPVLFVGFWGHAEDIQVQEEELRGLLSGVSLTRVPPAKLPKVWAGVRDFPLATARHRSGVRASLLPSSLPDLLAELATVTVRWQGLLAVWVRSGTVFARFPSSNPLLPWSWMQRLQRRLGGTHGKVWLDVWHPALERAKVLLPAPPLEAGVRELMEGIKCVLDPHGLLGTQRLPGVTLSGN